jgi:hypothetical protein
MKVAAGRDQSAKFVFAATLVGPMHFSQPLHKLALACVSEIAIFTRTRNMLKTLGGGTLHLMAAAAAVIKSKFQTLTRGLSIWNKFVASLSTRLTRC